MTDSSIPVSVFFFLPPYPPLHFIVISDEREREREKERERERERKREGETERERAKGRGRRKRDGEREERNIYLSVYLFLNSYCL